MYLAVRENLAPGATLPERLAALERLGFDAVEPIASLELPRGELAAAFAASTVRPSLVGGSRLLFDLDRERRSAGMDVMRARIALAAEIGAPGVLIAAYMPPPWPDLSPIGTGVELQRQVLVAQLRELAPLAERQGVHLVLEPLNRYESPLIRTLADGVEICKEIGSSSARIMADFFHMNIEEDDIAASIREAGAFIVHVHVAGNSRKQPGIGHLDFCPGFRALKELGYQAAVSIECSQLIGPPDEALRRSGDFLRAEWNAA